MNYNFCTLFDKNYLTRGLALHCSLIQRCHLFTLWILCMDDYTYGILTKMHLQNVRLIRLCELEDNKLTKIKPTRTTAEYCWTITPSLPLFIINKYPYLEHIAYLDADIFFYHTPQPIYEEFKGHSILIIKHNFSHQFEYLESKAGTYNVEFLIFRNNREGKRCLEWWREKCLEWCYDKVENGKFGDQAYLNDWVDRFQSVKILKHHGGGVAPWNVDQYIIKYGNNVITINHCPLIFYHFHAMKLYSPRSYKPAAGYNINKKNKRFIYKPYWRAIQKSYTQVKKVDKSFNFGFIPRPTLLSKIIHCLPALIKRK